MVEMSIDQLHMYSLTPKKTFKKKGLPPLGLKIFKVHLLFLKQIHLSEILLLILLQGLKESIVSRRSVYFFLHSEVAKSFRKWCLDILFPEEIYFQTLCRIDQDLYEKSGKIVQGESICNTLAPEAHQVLFLFP